MSVIVIGAGPAGLAATYELRKKGVDVLCLEERDVAGGRARGYNKEGYQFDLGAQFSANLCTTTFRLCRELGMEDAIQDFDFMGAMWRNGKLYPIPATINPLEAAKHWREILRFRGLPWKGYPQMARVAFHMLRRRRDFDFVTMDPEAVLALRNGVLVNEETILEDDDELKLVAVVSGG
ncbi:MAG: FAD-dependent oxidoreductase [Anaerolineae bacterium]|nr:FAD-dependent oxidoreductase [Anaerolineae bacterium]